jgi:hypothetical protein
MNKVLEEIDFILKDAIYSLEYASFNYDGTKDENVPLSLIESTGVGDSCIISARRLKTLLEAYKNQSSVSAYSIDVVKELLKKQREICANSARVDEDYYRGRFRGCVLNKNEILNAPEPELPQFSVSDEEDLVAKAKLLAVEAWRMLPDTCKKIMGESLKKTFTESLTEDIIYQFKK